MWWSLALAVIDPGTVVAATYSFTLTPAGTALTGTVGVTAATAGSMVGTFDATTNPEGTRTKPGLLGTFGATENVPVPVTLTPGFSGAVQSVPTGGLDLSVDASTGRVILSGLSLNLLPAGPVLVPSELTLAYESFRTRTPDSLYIGGFPLTLPLGDASLTELAAAQIGSSAGDLSEVEPGVYDFSISTLLLLNGAFESTLGALPLPPIPVPYTLTGRVGVMGDEAILTATSTVGFSNAAALGVALPGLPFPLPTILPPGSTANLLFDLTLDSVETELATTLTMAASGQLIPEPGALLVVVGLTWVLGRRRRTDP